MNNPVKYNDPTGHELADSGICLDDLGGCALYDQTDEWELESLISDSVEDSQNGEYFFDDANVTLSPEELEELRLHLDEWITKLDVISDFQAGTAAVIEILDALGLIGEAASLDPGILAVQTAIWFGLNNALDDLRDFDRALGDYDNTEVNIELGHNFREWGISVNEEIIIERVYDPIPVFGADLAIDVVHGFSNTINLFPQIMEHILNNFGN